MGRHGWRGGRGVQRGQISRLIEPCLLLLLQQKARHGYELIAELGKFGFDPKTIDSGLVYRALPDMEASGWVTSDWEIGTVGPPRRNYRITEIGREAFGAWQEELARTHDILHTLLGESSER